MNHNGWKYKIHSNIQQNKTTPTTLRIRRETTKTRETRFTHITIEASKILSDYTTKNLKNHQGSDPYIFMNFQGESGSFAYHKAMISARGTLMNMLRNAVVAVPELAMKMKVEIIKFISMPLENGSRLRLQMHMNRTLQKH